MRKDELVVATPNYLGWPQGTGHRRCASRLIAHRLTPRPMRERGMDFTHIYQSVEIASCMLGSISRAHAAWPTMLAAARVGSHTAVEPARGPQVAAAVAVAVAEGFFE